MKNASTNWDHPHACGDKRVLNVLMTIAQGSSPRVWGQVLTYTSVYVYCRIIPTRVGTSHIGNSKHIIRPDHPHACGDKTLSSKSLKDCWGSSPRVWGQDSFISIEMTSFRIIPTRVGTSLEALDAVPCVLDHPHACGDKSSLSFLAKEEQGSSPRVWGQANLDSLSADNIGIIPTRVGTSSLRLASLRLRWDHPHACGDKCGVPQLFYE